MTVSSARCACTFAILVALAAGCSGTRRLPYRFRAPMVGSVSAPDLADDLDHEPAPPARRTGRSRVRAPGVARGTPPPRPVRTATPAEALAGADGELLAARLRAMVGRRDRDANDLVFAFAALDEIGATGIDDQVRSADSGRALVALARERGALHGDGLPLLGDLVVFDHVEGDRPASLTGVVVSTDSDGTIEFVYLARGVVRRGLVNPSRPDVSRDEVGRSLNTFVRHSDGRDRRGARYRAGELFAGFIRLDLLLAHVAGARYKDLHARVVE